MITRCPAILAHILSLVEVTLDQKTSRTEDSLISPGAADVALDATASLIAIIIGKLG